MISFIKENKVNIDFKIKDNKNISYKLIEDLVQKSTMHIFNMFKIKNSQINFLFCENNHIQDLNYRFLDKNYPTDVLSFPSLNSYCNKGFLGDIAISVDKAKKQALNFKHSFLKEILLLSIHGILHLLGYDHELGLEEEKEMFELEKKIFLEVHSYIL